MDSSFTEAEKVTERLHHVSPLARAGCSLFATNQQRFVLGEMIKASHLDCALIVDFLKVHRVRPDWLFMELPRGKTNIYPVHKCPARGLV